MFDKERPYVLKYWKGKIYFSDRETSLALYIICSVIYCYRIRYFYFITVALASTATALHLKIMHNPEPKLDNKGQINVSICL